MLTIDRTYLDHNATTQPRAETMQALVELIQKKQLFWGNPSSIHLQSREPKNILRETRNVFAQHFGVQAQEIILNSGATEGNNTVLKSVWEILGNTKKEFLISSVEHPSVTKTAEYLQGRGAVIKWIPVNRDGQIDLAFIEENISDRTALVSVMFANNETGTIFPIEKISKIVKTGGALFHVDCVQALGKVPVNFDQLGMDYATVSGHKFYALKGCGVLFVKRGSPYINLLHGGGQERGRRGGTENILSIWSLQKALQYLPELSARNAAVQKLRDAFEVRVLETMSGVRVTARTSPRLSNTSSLVIDDVDGETLLMSLDLKGFDVSTGAACSSGNPEPSPVLIAMGLSREEAQSSLRVSLGWNTTEHQMNTFAEVLTGVVERIRRIKLTGSQSHVS